MLPFVEIIEVLLFTILTESLLIDWQAFSILSLGESFDFYMSDNGSSNLLTERVRTLGLIPPGTITLFIRKFYWPDYRN